MNKPDDDAKAKEKEKEQAKAEAKEKYEALTEETDEDEKWKNRCYSYMELGIKYSPDVIPAVASRRLKQWVMGNNTLLGQLLKTGWHRSQRLLTPRQVSCIVGVLGEP